MATTAAITLSAEEVKSGEVATATLVISKDDAGDATIRSISPIAGTSTSELPPLITLISFDDTVEENLEASFDIVSAGGWGEAVVSYVENGNPAQLVTQSSDGTYSSLERAISVQFAPYMEPGMSATIEVVAASDPDPAELTITNVGRAIVTSVAVVFGQPDMVDVTIPGEGSITKKFGVQGWVGSSNYTYDIAATVTLSDGTIVEATPDDLTITPKVG